MLHICTVHWQDDRWVDVQLEYLNRHLEQPFRIYAWLNDLPADHSEKFFYSTTEPVPQHAIKLNILADVVRFAAESPTDILIFLDGDAFPVAPLDEPLDSWLSQSPLAAIQRTEQYGDIQPHPSFCATTVEFWQKIAGDWKPGHQWQNSLGEWVTDPGGNLLKILDDLEIQWLPLHRSNRKNVHPLLFGVYENVLYHHCAGFRRPRTVYEIKEVFLRDQGAVAQWLWKAHGSLHNRGGLGTSVARRVEPLLPGRRKAVEITDRNVELSEHIFGQLLEDPRFYRQFL